MANAGASVLPFHVKAFRNCSSSAPLLSQLERSEEVKYTRLPSQDWETMLTWEPIFCSRTSAGVRGWDTSNTRTVPSMKLSTKRKRSSAERLMSTGSGVFDGSPIGAISSASKVPSSLRKTPQSFEVRALEENA